MCRGGGGCRDDVRNGAATKGTCPSPMRHGRGLRLGHQGLVVESCRLRCGKRGTCPHSLEGVQTCGDRRCCADNGAARASVMFLEHRCGVSVVDRRGLCRPRCNAAQGPIEALLHHRPCFGAALLDDTLDQLDVKPASGIHLAAVQASRCRLLKLRNRDTASLMAAPVDAEPAPPLAPASDRSARTSSRRSSSLLPRSPSSRPSSCCSSRRRKTSCVGPDVPEDEGRALAIAGRSARRPRAG
jgi:hypothetical protein